MSLLRPALEQAFAAAFGASPDLVALAPGRVNLIGEHTDYNDGFVLPMAIGVHSLVALRRRSDRSVRVVACDYGAQTSEFTLDAPILPDSIAPWADYVRGMIAAMQADGCVLPGMDVAITGNVPQGSGLSSSASLSVALGTAVNALSNIGLSPSTIARFAQASECDFVGTRCGIMDQLVSARGEAGHALLIDCRSLDCRAVPVSSGLAVVIIHSGIVRGLVEGAYNERRAQCEAAAAALGAKALRDVDLHDLENNEAALNPLAFRRARHVVSENARTLAAADALAAHDVAALGELMAQSHASMRDDFAITLPPIDELVSELRDLIGGEGGARMTGGGFGGAVVAIMPQSRVDEVIGQLRYRTPAGAPPLILTETPQQGARLI